MLMRSAPYPAICPLLRRLVAQARHLDEGPVGRQCCYPSTGFSVLQEIVLVMFYLTLTHSPKSGRSKRVFSLTSYGRVETTRRPTTPGEAIARNREICSRHGNFVICRTGLELHVRQHRARPRGGRQESSRSKRQTTGTVCSDSPPRLERPAEDIGRGRRPSKAFRSRACGWRPP